LSVDDANTNDAGAGHVEAWVLHATGATVFNVAPAYAPWDGVELVLALAREQQSSLESGTVQLKWRITASREQGCNAGATVGATHVGQGGGNSRFVNGLLTCNLGREGSLHANAGAIKASQKDSIATWGVAFEREAGAATPHVEWFGAKGSKPTAQAGVRGKIGAGRQLDGTVGRSDGETLYSLGVKFQF